MESFESLSQADAKSALSADDLELLATAAYMVGRDDDYVGALERAHHAHVDAGRTLRAVRCAFWAGLCLAFRGNRGRATGWFGRAQRLLAREDPGCVERGYLLLPVIEDHAARADFEAMHSTATQAAEIARAPPGRGPGGHGGSRPRAGRSSGSAASRRGSACSTR